MSNISPINNIKYFQIKEKTKKISISLSKKLSFNFFVIQKFPIQKFVITESICSGVAIKERIR